MGGMRTQCSWLNLTIGVDRIERGRRIGRTIVGVIVVIRIDVFRRLGNKDKLHDQEVEGDAQLTCGT